MPKSLDFVYEWVSPIGPLANNKVPSIADLMYGQFRVDKEPWTRKVYFYSLFDNFNILSTYNVKPWYTNKFLYEMSFTATHYNDWTRYFAEINTDVHIKDKTKDRLYDGQGYLLFNIPFEGWVHDKLFDVMYQNLRKIDFPLKNVIYVSNCVNGQAVYEDYCHRKNITPEINVEYIPTCRIQQTGVEEPLRDRSNNPYVPGPKKKDFLCFQRRWSDHRLVFFLSMWRKGLLDNFYMSMSDKQPESGASFESNMKHVANRRPIFQITDDEIEKSKQALPLILDTTNFDRYPMESSANDVEQYYKDSMINIISETNFFTPEIHLNEKTYKPIAFKQPFIMMSAPYSLQHLKDVGFKTFDRWWSEDYDLITNNDDRMLEINRIVEEITNWSDEKKVQFTHEVKDIVEFNCEHLATMSHPEVKHFEEKYGN